MNARLQAIFQSTPGRIRRVLEAGAGSISYFVLAEGAELIALDISHGQLMRNPLTSLRVQGDLQRLPIAPGSVDMVVCFNVIEHVPDAALALEGMRNCLAPCGVLLLGFPHRSSLKALVTRVTPLAVHRAWYRHVVGKKDRGEGYFDAFPMVFHPAMRCRESLPGWRSAVSRSSSSVPTTGWPSTGSPAMA